MITHGYCGSPKRIHKGTHNLLERRGSYTALNQLHNIGNCVPRRGIGGRHEPFCGRSAAYGRARLLCLLPCRLTHDVGLKLAELQLEPRLGAALLASGKLGCSEEMCTIAAIMSVRSIWAASKSKAFHAARQKFAVAEGAVHRAMIPLLH